MESPNCSAAAPRASKSAVVADGTSGGGGSLKKRSSHRLGAVAAGRNGYRQGRRSCRSRGRNDGQRRSWPWDPRRGVSTPCRWTRGPAGPETIINSKWRSASGSGCSSARPSDDAAQRRQGCRRCRVARRRNAGRDQISGRGGIDSLRRSTLGDSRRGSGVFCRARAALRGHGKNRIARGVGGRKVGPRPGLRSTVVTAADV